MEPLLGLNSVIDYWAMEWPPADFFQALLVFQQQRAFEPARKTVGADTEFVP